MSTRTNFLRSSVSWRLALALLAVSCGTGDVQAQRVFPDAQFENWVFNNLDAETARQRYEAQLKLRIEEIDRACGLTEGQKQKLRLMGCGDIKRMFDSFEKAKHQFKLLGNDLDKLQEVMPLVESVQLAQRRPFQDGSLFNKSLRHALTQEQFARCDVVDRARREFQHRAQIEFAVHRLEQTLPLLDAQRRQLIALLTKDVTPVRTSSEDNSFILLSRVALLPDHKIKPLLTDTQWTAWEKHMQLYKNPGADEESADPPAEALK